MIMSRKNRNGNRRNYNAKTYSRDFLTPTPIERAIQEVNKPASPQAVAVSDRIACDDKCSYEYKRMPAAWLEFMQFMQGMAILKHKASILSHFFLNFSITFYCLPVSSRVVKHTAFGPLLTSFYSLGFLLIFTETAIASD